MTITHEKLFYDKGNCNDTQKVRNVSATNKIIRTANALRCVESEMMSFSYKINRSEQRREQRRAKR